MFLPRPLAERLQTAQRDLSLVIDGFRGNRGPSFQKRSALGRHHTSTQVTTTTAKLTHAKLMQVVDESADARSLHLDVVGIFEPGQFYTLVATVDGQTLRRAYSASSQPGQPLRLTIKRIAGGVVSEGWSRRLKAGDNVELLGPSGHFVVAPADTANHVLLIAGGSGVTPMRSIAESQLRTTDRTVTLIVGQRSPADAIFQREFEQLQTDFPTRFRLLTIYDVDNLRLDQVGCASCLSQLGIDSAAQLVSTAAFVCGPEPMMEACRTVLLERGLNVDHIHEERFTQPHLRERSDHSFAPQLITLRTPSRIVDRRSEAGQTVLEVGLAAGISMPFSCTMGGCAACKVKLLSGQVEMEEPNCLTRSEREGGYILGCIARPTSACTVEVP